MKLASFDLEISKILPENVNDLHAYAPLGISCAAIALSDTEQVEIFQGKPNMTANQCQELVVKLQDYVNNGYKILTWNGCGFDFRVLAGESGLHKECAELAMNHIDMMIMVTFRKGHYLSLEKALVGAGFGGKIKRVVLSDGTVKEDMSGVDAPKLWAAGEYNAVLEYLRTDVLLPLELANKVAHEKVIRWTSNRGYPQSIRVSGLETVVECFRLPEPDVSWMSNPPKRAEFVSWMPKE